MRKRTKTPEESARFCELWASGKTQQEIGFELGGMSKPGVSVWAKRLGLEPRSKRFARSISLESFCNDLPEEAKKYVEQEAEKRDLSEKRLLERVLRTAVRDRILGAILDDGS